MMTFTRGELAKILKVSERKIEGWAARHVLMPIGKGGRGHHFQFDLEDMMVGAIVKVAQEFAGGPWYLRPGFIASQARLALRQYVENGDDEDGDEEEVWMLTEKGREAIRNEPPNQP